MKNVRTKSIVAACAIAVAAASLPALADTATKQSADVLGVENNLKVGEQTPFVTDKAARESDEAAQNVSDGWITTKVKAVLIYDRNVEGTDIEVNTKNGVVTLRGQVESVAEREQAVSLAREVKGVKKVLSELSVG